MQRYIMRDKGFSTSQGFVFLDEADRQLYRAEAKNWTISREYEFKDIEGKLLLHLKQKLFSLSGPVYTLSRDGSPCATIRKSGGKYTVSHTDGSELQIAKSRAGLEYTFTRDDRTIATLSRKLVSLSENCTIEVETSEDAELILASALAVFDSK